MNIFFSYQQLRADDSHSAGGGEAGLRASIVVVRAGPPDHRGWYHERVCSLVQREGRFVLIIVFFIISCCYAKNLNNCECLF